MNGREKFSKSKTWKVSNMDEELESRMGFENFLEGDPKLGWLVNLHPSSRVDQVSGETRSCVNLFFISQDGSTFKAQVDFEPYFYIGIKGKNHLDVEAFIRRKYEGLISNTKIMEREDLDLKNHLSGLKNKFIRVSFKTVQHLMEVKREMMAIVHRNRTKQAASEAYEAFQSLSSIHSNSKKLVDHLEYIVELREYDVPYHVRFAIDRDVRCGLWYSVFVEHGSVQLKLREDLLQRAEPTICAFDIETTKQPLKFPDSSFDFIMMISYMINGKGFLITNRQVVGADIQDFEYTPKPEFAGRFTVWNVENEFELLRRWFDHMKTVKPGVYVTYNGDSFDWPFVEERARQHGLSMFQEIGFRCDNATGECRSRFACHLDAFAWVKRDSYLPQGSQGLKAVTKAKLGYTPEEVDPEEMVRFAMEYPQTMATYSVSDAVSTYYLYTTYVHPFIYSLATIIPMPPDEVLRKGSGTLCEMLLTVQAFKGNIICPNKKVAEEEKFYRGKLVESETYIGGHVECLESGVFRSDLKTKFRLDPDAYQLLIDKLDADLEYALLEEGKLLRDDVENYEQVKDEIIQQLEALKNSPIRDDFPVIYHLDVAAMYPNIMLTNRLQPPSIVTDDICAACDFNKPNKSCLRKMEWVWRGETYMAKRSDYNQIKNQIEVEQFAKGEGVGGAFKYFHQLSKDEQQAKIKERVKKYCQKVYKRVLDKPTTEVRVAGVCQRENPFYIDTVRSFRDRRYEYKGKNKFWKSKEAEAKQLGDEVQIREAKDMVVLFDSLQLAHKCILNSFYGYVMRKGARWYSMEMAGITTYTGAKLIQSARMLVEKVGKPLELDTDGIWCCLPASFPESFTFKPKDSSRKKLTISYPCVMLNADVKKNNTNDQYQTLIDGDKKTYKVSSECSIAFEVDGPYKAMILPASKEEGVLIKKRYAVFNHDGSLAELKGFEIKRRGELKLIKIFQAEVFKQFLSGSTLEECYGSVAKVANQLLDLLDNEGQDMEDSVLLEHISESSTMSKSLEDYGNRKSCATTCAKRLADFLGDVMVKDKGLACKYIVAKYPQSAPVSERAIPVAIFSAEPEIMRAYVRRWCREGSDHSIRSIVDWDYYRGRLSSSIQKIVTIPAAMQNIRNPVPRVKHPDWLGKKIRERDDKHRQKNIRELMFTTKYVSNVPYEGDERSIGDEVNSTLDMEDAIGKQNSTKRTGRQLHQPVVIKFSKKKKFKGRLGQRWDNEGLEENVQCNEQLEQSLNGNDTTSMQEVAYRERSNSPDRQIVYKDWLEHKKRKWKADRFARKIPRVVPGLMDSNGNIRTGLSSGVEGIFRKREAALSKSHWQILQVCPGATLGEFMIWVMAGPDLHKVPVRVDRNFYINAREIEGSVPGSKVTRFLPRGRKVHNLFQVFIPELQFHKMGKIIREHLADPNIEGVYETKVPLLTHLVLELGCVCSVDPRHRGRSVTNGWELSQLRMKSTAECSYLETGRTNLTFFFIFQSGTEQRGLFLLYSPVTSVLSIIFVSSFTNRDVTAGQLERQAREIMAHTADLTGYSEASKEVTVKLEWTGSQVEASKVLQRAIQDTTAQHLSPSLALLESPFADSLSQTIPILSGYPLIHVPHNVADDEYPPLGWQAMAAKTALQRCATVGPWLSERKAMARYAHVPLANFDSDWVLFIADMFLARALRDRQHVLWMSDDGMPDLGGMNLVTEEGNLSEEFCQPELSFSGAYRSITVELRISHLAVNSLLKSGLVNELEGGSLFTGMETSTNDDVPLGTTVFTDESTACGPAMRVVRQLVQSWVSDAVANGNVFANLLLLHLYRWLCSPNSRLHDPALHKALHKVMQKVLGRLLTELKKLGASIVFADFSRVILATGKRTPVAARDYCNFIVRTLKTNELFKWLDLEPQRAWYSLLFMDQYNYGGVAAKLYEEKNVEDQSAYDESRRNSETPVESQSETASNVGESLQIEEKPDVVCSWNIAEFLPPACQDYFLMLVSEYIWVPWSYSKERIESRSEGLLGTQSITVSEQAQLDTEEVKFLKGKLKFHFTEKMLKVVKDIQRRMGMGTSTDMESEAANWQFPKLAGSHLHLENPALEFIKSVCTVFALDVSVDHQVLIMKRQLLKVIHVREFSEAAIFRNPCLSFTLPNVICSFCNDCRDLDLCRDVGLMNGEWKCAQPNCQQPYNKEWIESALIQVVRKRCRSYQVQDLKCKKCRQVKAGRLTEHCSCAGDWTFTEPASSIEQSLKIFLNIAHYHGFKLLEEFVKWLEDAALVHQR